MSANIKVMVQVMEHPSPRDIHIVIPLEENLIRDTFTPIDVPNPRSDPFMSALTCTSTSTIVKTRMERKRAAEMISKVLTKAILDAMESNDTVDGYRQ